MDTNSGKLLAKEEVFQIVGSAIEVLNALGHGLLEKPYENALAVEFGLRKIPSSDKLCLMSFIKDTTLVSSFPT
jgi:GxxExxY protein